MSGPILSAEGLAFTHGSGLLFEDVGLDLHSGGIVALVGGSGCGKSSLLRVLAALAPPLRGTVRFEGQDLRQPHPRAGLLFQQPGLLPWLSCEANVGFGLDFKHQPRLSRDERAARVAHALQAVGLAGAERRYPAELSGGMLQRAALARALAREPLLLLADEPFSALDPITRGEMQALLRRVVLASRSAALLVTHDVDEALRVADHIVLMGSPTPGRPARLLRRWTHRAGATDEALRHQILQSLRAHSPARDDTHASNPEHLLIDSLT